MKNILITGINGQDGVILTSKLLNVSKDIKILGTSEPQIYHLSQIN